MPRIKKVTSVHVRLIGSVSSLSRLFVDCKKIIFKFVFCGLDNGIEKFYPYIATAIAYKLFR